MKRKIEAELMKWKNAADRKPLILNGARQVGKTYILREFGKNNFQNVVYINLERNMSVASYFNDNISPKKIIRYLEAEVNEKIVPGETLIILDEIQSCERALTSLKYFEEEASKYNIAAAGSLLGVAINREHFSFPVGKVKTLQLFPMDFEEFLWAKNEYLLIDEIVNGYKNVEPLPEGLHNKAIELYRDYLIVGGMPACINKYLETDSYIDVSIVQSEILNNYIADMAKYASAAGSVKIRACYNSISVQLAKENKKFQYKIVQKGGSSSLFGASLDWLKQAGIILECQKIEQGTEPIAAYADPSAFKIYMSDVGLLINKSGMSYATILTGESNSFMGAVTENYIAQQLASAGLPLYYWSKTNSQAELDFVTQKSNHIIGIEVKKSKHVKSRSLTMFINAYKPDVAIRFSEKNFGKYNDFRIVPHYGVFCLFK